MKNNRIGRDNAFAYLLLSPSLLLLAGLIGYPMVYNIYISFRKVPLNPKKAMQYIGLDNYKAVFRRPRKSLCNRHHMTV